FLLEINRRIPAAQPSDFRHVASTHVKTHKGGGVVGVTVGARKAKILFTLLSQNPCPISRLIIDVHCALALLNLLDRAEFARLIRNEGQSLVQERANWSEGTRRLIPA